MSGNAIISRVDARAAGLSFYFVGEQCPHGHIVKRRVDNHACTACVKIHKQRWERKNRERSRRQHCEWRAKNLDKAHAIAKRHRQKHSKKIREKMQRWRENNHEKIISWLRNYRRKNPERHRIEVKDWMKRNPEKRRAQHHVRKCRKRSAEGRFTGADIKNILKQQRNRCAYFLDCGHSLAKRSFEIDHIIPLARGGTNWPNNIQLLCADCNSKKHAHDPIDYAHQQGRML